jgi:hypothetical protein
MHIILVKATAFEDSAASNGERARYCGSKFVLDEGIQ